MFQKGARSEETTSITGINTGLAQLALMLHGMGRGGLGNPFNLPTDPYSMSPQTPQPMANSWATMPMPSGHSSKGRGSIIPAQWAATAIPFELLGDLVGRTVEVPPYAETMPIDIAPGFHPLPPYNPPFPIPDSVPGGKTKLPPITIPQWPVNPGFEIPAEAVDDPSKLEPDEPVSEIPDDPECAAEWAWALDQCGKEYLELRKRRSGEHKYFNHDRCARGYVSERCGGNAVRHGPKDTPPPGII